MWECFNPTGCIDCVGCFSPTGCIDCVGVFNPTACIDCVGVFQSYRVYRLCGSVSILQGV